MNISDMNETELVDTIDYTVDDLHHAWMELGEQMDEPSIETMRNIAHKLKDVMDTIIPLLTGD